MTTQNELVVIDKKNAMEVFTQANGLDPFLKKVRDEIDSFVPDLSTAKGRKEIASIAHKVAKSKTYLDGVGKELVAELKQKPKLIDAERKRMREMLEAWKDEVRQPLTEWENIEKDRVAKHNENLAEISSIENSFVEGMTSEMIKGLILKLENINVDEDWQEFQEQGASSRSKAMDNLTKRYDFRLNYENEQAELEALRKEKAAKEAKEREERIAKEAAEKAKKDAEEKAARDVEQARLREEQLKLDKERIENEKREAEIKAAQDKIDAQKKAEQEKKDAIAQERRNIEAENKRRQEAEEARQKDVDHRKGINNQTLSLMEENGVTTELATKIITLAAQGKLGNLKMSY
mgnify:CR=1 FL=1